MKEGLLGILLLVIGILLFIGVNIFQMNYENKASELACKNIGFESYDYHMGQTYCVDKEKNLYYVDMKCDGIFLLDCTAKQITIGDNRVVTH